MRTVFCNGMMKIAGTQESLVFMTGDLGFMALEPLRDMLGPRFINAGVAEQNMVSMAAGLAKNGLRPWVYSIAPFIYARPFEQIRNDVCLHHLPVAIVGNGGGYGYGVMGATHHALEDYGVLLTLNGLRAYIPAFDEDLAIILGQMSVAEHPSYLRLGLAEQPKEYVLPTYSAWRRLEKGNDWVVLAVGPIAGGLWRSIRENHSVINPSLWLVSELPLDELPLEFLSDLKDSPNLLVVEEHVAQGGVGQMLASQLVKAGIPLSRFETRTALGYPSGRYGSQRFHRRESEIDAASITTFLTEHARRS